MSIMYRKHNNTSKLGKNFAKLVLPLTVLMVTTGCMTVPQSHVDNWFEYVGVNTSGYVYYDEDLSPKKIKSLSTGELHQSN